MLDDLLPYYNQELTNIRHMAAEFAKLYPKVASSLRLASSDIEDPNVARLIEAFAFLTANIRYKLEDDFPELAEAILENIAPHYLSPIPAFSIVEFKCQPELTTSYTLPKNTLIETKPGYGETCYFNTVYDNDFWPITIKKSVLTSFPNNAPLIPSYFGKANAVINITLECAADRMTFSMLQPKKLRFFINANNQLAFLIYEFIINNSIAIALANTSSDEKASFVSKSCIRPVGFEEIESLLPYSARTPLSYRTLTEFFIFPEKFLFFDIELSEELLADIDMKLEMFIYLDRYHVDLEKNIDAETFKLSCTPVVNLFQQTAEPIRLDHTLSEYRVIPDARRLSPLEVYSIKKVMSVDEDKQIDYEPLYGIKHDINYQKHSGKYYWTYKRRTMPVDNSKNKITNIYLTFLQLDFNPLAESDKTIHVEILCTNGNLPSQLPFGNESCLQLSSVSAPLTEIICLKPFTKTLHSELRNGVRWKLISQLSLNHLSLVDHNDAEILKEIFRLYNITNSDEIAHIIDGVVAVRSRRISTRCFSSANNALCRGIEITLTFDEMQYTGSSLFLFAEILERYFANYATINAFTKLIIVSARTNRILYQWLPRSGNKIIL